MKRKTTSSLSLNCELSWVERTCHQKGWDFNYSPGGVDDMQRNVSDRHNVLTVTVFYTVSENAYSTFLVLSFLLTLFWAATELTHSGVTRCLWNCCFNRKHRIYLSLQICVRQTVPLIQKPGRLQNLATDAGMCLHCIFNCKTHVHDTMQRLDAVHRWHMDKHITKHRSCWSIEKAFVCMRESNRTPLWTSA